ncbi:tyrosine-type recombinase/integrase [Crossiella sp. CA-258035]|uniref:tyrosine-type recombinase/integrase n=1 Tax=Crossiella sp. CA-258035 TaxID=2981138 RepID=UPI0024BC13E2|nr:tyrosine-type recombinase/integrase [Crossiella sp. CA-258035]WHT21917.1 tyrosine-type recombinase/integrase [Crossiella sp. CA-258035]
MTGNKQAKNWPPIGVKLSVDIENIPASRVPFRARVRWHDPGAARRLSLSESFETESAASDWIAGVEGYVAGGQDPRLAHIALAAYGDLKVKDKSNIDLAFRGLAGKTLDPYLAGWRKRIVPDLGHLAVGMITRGVVDRAVHSWIADECSKSTVKNTIAALVRIMEQACRDETITRNPARITGWQREYIQHEDELDDPRSLALPSWEVLTRLADSLVAHSAGQYKGWGDVVVFAACAAARIGEVSGCRGKDIDTRTWEWNIRRQTTPGPGGLTDKGTKGRRARKVPIIREIRELVQRRIDQTNGEKNARVFVGPRGGRISTAVFRDATHWDEVVTKMGFEHLRRHDLRHTGLTWLADAGVPVHHLQKIAGHGSLTTTQRYLHPDGQSVTNAGELLSQHLGNGSRSTAGPRLRAV